MPARIHPALADKVTTVEVGEMFTDHTGSANEVKPACEAKHNGRWYCVTCKRAFANQLQKDIHIGNGRAHRLVWVCLEHGAEKP